MDLPARVILEGFSSPFAFMGVIALTIIALGIVVARGPRTPTWVGLLVLTVPIAVSAGLATWSHAEIIAELRGPPPGLEPTRYATLWAQSVRPAASAHTVALFGAALLAIGIAWPDRPTVDAMPTWRWFTLPAALLVVGAMLGAVLMSLTPYIAVLPMTVTALVWFAAIHTDNADLRARTGVLFAVVSLLAWSSDAVAEQALMGSAEHYDMPYTAPWGHGGTVAFPTHWDHLPALLIPPPSSYWLPPAWLAGCAGGVIVLSLLRSPNPDVRRLILPAVTATLLIASVCIPCMLDRPDMDARAPRPPDPLPLTTDLRTLEDDERLLPPPGPRP